MNPETIKIIKQQTSSFINKFRFKYKYLILLKAIEKIPEVKRQEFVEIIYNKYKGVGSFPILKFLSKAKVNFYNLDLKIITYNGKLIGLILDSKINLKNRMIEKIEDIKEFEENSEIIEELDLSNNRINKISNLENLKKLKKLYLKNNYIEDIEGLENLDNLELLNFQEILILKKFLILLIIYQI